MPASTSVPFLRLAFGALTAALLAVSAAAQDFPARPITIIVPQPVGSASDNVTRPIAQAMSQTLGQPVVVENRPGAAGMIGMGQAAKAKADGYTLVVISNTTMAANPSMFKKLPYDAEKDYAPIALMGRTSMMYVVRPDFRADSVEALAAEAKRRGVPLTAGYGSSTAQVALNMLTTATGISATPVPYQGTPKLVIDLLGGNVDLAVVDVGAGVVQARTGKVKPLAIVASRRLETSGNVPAMAEKYPGVHLDAWIALAAPAGTPEAIILKINAAVNAAASRANVRQAFAGVAIDLATSTPRELNEMIKADQQKWPGLIRAAGIQPE
ncbi:MAG: tripartite tricarboxylate transporter substrate binding protein [Burkholderiales bacterium]